nr:ribosome-recycling factor, mitochondrial-like [Cherax quadricarinatus]XP_053646046.1 ribosome-recycling factor, mitochondrial-like [Cherax quadricarinatus]
MAVLGPVAVRRMRLAVSSVLHIRWMSSVSHCPRSALVKNQNIFSPPSWLLRPHPVSQFYLRNYAKSKDKHGKDKKAKVHLSDSELSELVNVTKMKEEFSDIVENLKQEYIKNLSLRTSAGSIENLLVKLEGDEYPLNEVAQISRKSSHTLVINASAFPQALVGMMTALRESGMNLNPQQEGTTIYVALPKITKEHRENLAKNAKTLFNRCKDHLRDSQNQYVRKVKRKEDQASEDLVHDAQLKIREIADTYLQEAETMMIHKQKELLKTN